MPKGRQRPAQPERPAPRRTGGDMWEGALQAEMSAGARALVRWQEEARLSQIATAERVEALRPRMVSKLATHATISRWQAPERFQAAHLLALRIVTAALGRSLRELVDVMDRAREQYLADATGAGVVERERVEARAEEERLLADYRAIPAPARPLIAAQVAAAAQQARRAQTTAQTTASPTFSQYMMPAALSADDALETAFGALGMWEATTAAQEAAQARETAASRPPRQRHRRVSSS